MKEKFLAGGSILTAVLASSCCIGPLILAAVGMSGLSFIGSIAPYRPVFIGITFALIGASYYFTYGRKKPCCPGESAKRRRWAQEVPLWAITAIAVGLVAFTYTREYLGSNKVESSLLKSDYKLVTLKVEGMTCSSCAKSIKSTISKVKGVKALRVDLESGEVTIGFERSIEAVAPISELLTILEKQGYKAVVDEKSG